MYSRISKILKPNILEIMSDFKIRKVTEIKKELNEKGLVFNVDYKSSQIEWALKHLLVQKKIKRVKHGTYMIKYKVSSDDEMKTLLLKLRGCLEEDYDYILSNLSEIEKNEGINKKSPMFLEILNIKNAYEECLKITVNIE